MNKGLIALLLSVSVSGLFAQKTTKTSFSKATVYTTADKSNLRISESGTLSFSEMKQPLETQLVIFIDPTHSFQTITGIGGALTDASAETYAKLPPNVQKEFLTAYYDKEKGIGYSFARTNINSCDFSSDTYTYVVDNDAALKSFDLSHDKKYKIPFIKAAMQAAGGNLPMFVSPWSPPAWMKDNNNMLKGGKLKPEFRQAWSNYYVKFIKGYEALGIPVWGLSVQNEPMATQRWESCIFTAEEERDFIKNHLGPTLHKNGLANKKLIGWDHNRDQVYQRASTILNDPEAAKYVWGIGYHWYETWTGAGMNFANVKLVNETFPSKNLIFTEGCIEKFDINKVNEWWLGERYGTSLVNDFNSGTVAWTDWNILLDEKGGPNHVGNFCFAPIHADTRDGKLIYTNSYYYLGHFSKFVKPGAKRIASSASRDFLSTTAFRNTDGSLAVVVLNTTDQSLPYHLWIDGKAAQTTSMPHSISTVIIR
ncbi:glycoside hydrolase family 30 protein [Desertivirga brevis]|uniref:glycoside hydrolase family 30 protein n=1 Tax=Desertivirga brevis TaxID=2810310 RepID=UPI001A9626EB|nr:glycoside hydrolase family 30 protein [Pedobacter sp. SYSU D00873]